MVGAFWRLPVARNIFVGDTPTPPPRTSIGFAYGEKTGATGEFNSGLNGR